MNTKKITFILIKAFLSGSFLIAISIFFIWSYLFQIGRIDLFLRIVSFKELISFTGVVIIASILLFMSIFFLPSLIGSLIIQRENSSVDGYLKIKTNHMLILYFSSFISLFLVTIASFIDSNYEIHIHIYLIMAISSIICIALSTIYNKHHLDFRFFSLASIKENKKIIFLVLGKPFLIGIASWTFFFPLLIVTKTLQFNIGDSEIIQVFHYLMIGCLVSFTTLLPGFIFLNLDNKFSIITQALITLSGSVVTLIMLFPFLPVIPLLILNLSMKLAGINDLNILRFSISVNNRPAEKFKNPEWKLEKSKDGKFYLFNGVTLFSFGSYSLLCPVTLTQSYKNTFKYVFASSDFDKKMRDKLQKDMKECQLFEVKNLKY